METINLQSVRIALNRDEMEEMVGGSSSGSATSSSDCFWAGLFVAFSLQHPALHLSNITTVAYCWNT